MTDTTTDTAEIEARVLAGDDTITEADAVRAFTEAEGRRWFAGLRERRAERLAAAEQAQDQAARRAAALEHARTALDRSSPQRIAAAYDEAVRALTELLGVVADRNATVDALADAPEPDHAPGAVRDDLGRATVTVDGQSWAHLAVDPLLSAALGRAGATLSNNGHEWLAGRPSTYAASPDRDPAIVQVGRTELPPAV